MLRYSRFRIDSYVASCLFVCLSICCHKYLSAGWLNNLHFPISASAGMVWNSSFLILLASLFFMDVATAQNPCKTEVSVPGMVLKGFVFKKGPSNSSSCVRYHRRERKDMSKQQLCNCGKVL